MRDKAKKDSKEQEEAIIHEIDDSMSGFLQWIEEINHRKIDGRALGINIDRLKKLNKDMHDDVVGFIGRRLDERLVSTDSELATILGDPNDESRKKNFGKFYDRIRKDAIRALIKEVEEAVEKQSSSIEQEIQIRMKEVQSSMRDELRALEDLQKTQRSQKSDLAIRQVDYMYHADLCDTMSEQLGKAEECGWKS
ncbi:MAG: hypothetical protein IKH16_05300 [Selenomonadaceae bacterium]|nr:hypothetical protein [Selenomonadaceae bacterium]